MDQTTIYLDLPSNRTYETSGATHVEAVHTGQNRTRVSVAMTAAADGTKLKPFILIPRKRPLRNFVCPRNVVVFYGADTFNQTILVEHWISKVIEPYQERLNPGTELHLLIDQAPCHSAMFKEALTESNVNTIFIPKRMTKLLQPADVSWFRPLKVAYHRRWTDWLIHGQHTFTRAGNMVSPGYARSITWISEIWAEMTRNTIEHSFDVCGITTSSLVVLNRQLRHFIATHELSDDVEDLDPAAEIDGFDGNDEETQRLVPADEEDDIQVP